MTQDWLPESAAWGFDSDPMIDNVNTMYLSRGGVETNQRFYFADDWWTGGSWGCLRCLAGIRVAQRGLYFTESYPPFSLTSGMVTTANGEAYDLDETGAHRRLLEENLVSWVDTIRAEILAIDPPLWSRSGSSSPRGPILRGKGMIGSSRQSR